MVDILGPPHRRGHDHAHGRGHRDAADGIVPHERERQVLQIGRHLDGGRLAGRQGLRLGGRRAQELGHDVQVDVGQLRGAADGDVVIVGDQLRPVVPVLLRIPDAQDEERSVARLKIAHQRHQIVEVGVQLRLGHRILGQLRAAVGEEDHGLPVAAAEAAGLELTAGELQRTAEVGVVDRLRADAVPH